MLDLVFLIIILLGIATIGFVIARKFPQLANLDVDNLPAEKILRKKKEIINRRIEEQSKEIKVKTQKYLVPIRKWWGRFQLRFRIYVGKIERLWHHEINKKQKEDPTLPAAEVESRVNNLLSAAEQDIKNNQPDKAEEKYIAAIKLDNRSASAYSGLGDAYMAKGSIEEARETYRFVLQLNPANDGVLVKLAEIAESQGDLEEAIEYYQRAVITNDSLSPRFSRLAELLMKVGQPEVAKEAILAALDLEPQNPKYLDLLAEIAILCRDKKLANEAYNSLRLVNPENNKLPDLQDRINKI